ncbi:hypothetical protein H1V43_33070 [Streptomyces sp. PSKA54]|uniref:F5/8 type C domain-containing protein n=1 Tax=Streptomyces himalayensis subsp. aureolus TaxID=2758039 RepID=A0A7W2D795_9ACTN|nr:hypothetical protein [Streptomyces himalayensis]MBA4866073.1 hypothetical protein [Streptomyces himalayensis subsp. aureolus]
MTAWRHRLLHMALAVLLVLLPTQLINAPHAHSASVTSGNYYASTKPTDGNPDSDGALVRFQDSLLFNGNQTDTVGWRGSATAPKTVTLVFDMLRDGPLSNISIVSKSQNEFWTFDEIKVQYRPEASPTYNTAKSAARARGLLDYRLDVPMGDKQARFVRIKLTRTNQYLHIPLSEINFTIGTGTVDPTPAPALTESQMQQELTRADSIETGNYYAGVTPTDGTPDSAGGLVPFQNSKLFNGDHTDVVGWRGNATAPKSVTLVFDLLRDHPLGNIMIQSKAENEFWTFDEIEVTYRPEASETYRIAGSATRDRSELDYRLDIPMGDKQARFVRVKMTRTNQYLHFPLSEVDFAIGSGSIGQNPAPPLTVSQMQEELSRYTRMVDTYGQYLYKDWAGKVTSDAQLQQDAANEATKLADVEQDLTTYDQYGGFKALGKHTGTGYFRLAKIDGKWWFITPEGHKFILKGVDATSADDWGYGTLYKNADGSLRDVFDGLPDSGTYGPAYSGNMVSFVKANLMRKYGTADWKTPWRDITKKRLIDWGFNAQSKWSRDGGLTMPWIGQITAPSDVMRIQYGIDPFDPQFGAKLDRHIQALNIAANAGSPWLIGYFFDNERGWDDAVMTDMLQRTSTQPAKRAFVAYLNDAYDGDLNQVNTILGTSAATWQDLENTKIIFSKVPVSDRTAFVTEASKAYYSAIQAAIRKQDTNHLFLGSALVPTWHSSLEWNVGGRDYLDAISLDVYSNSASYLKDYEPYDKPVLNLEYSFSTHDRGLRAINAATRAESIAERGSMHKAFAEEQARSPVFVGSGWFIYYDQAVTGRASDGENYNFGLVNQQDQPYSAMTDVMRDTHRRLELIHQSPGPPLSAARTKEFDR